jgi:hypothetical protein
MLMSPRNTLNTMGVGGPGEAQETLDLPTVPLHDSLTSPAQARAPRPPFYGAWICTGRPIPIRSAVASVSVICGTLQSRP